MKVIVPLDGSAFAEAILPTIALLAHKGGIDVKLVSVLKPSSHHATWKENPISAVEARANIDSMGTAQTPVHEPEGVLAQNPEQDLGADTLVLEDYLKRVSQDHFLGRAGAAVLEGEHVAEELIRHFRSEEADFIAMATHGRTGLAKLVMGSVAEDIMKTGDVPVMLVRPKGLN